MTKFFGVFSNFLF